MSSEAPPPSTIEPPPKDPEIPSLPASPPRTASLTRLRRGMLGVVLFVSLLCAYHANRTVLSEGDAVPTENLALSLLATGRFSFDPDRFPEMFKWKSHPPFVKRDDFFVMRWNDEIGDRLMGDWRRDGHLEFNGPRYYLTRSELRHTYVSTFGPIPGLVLLPVMAPFYALDHGLAGELARRTTAGKLAASLLVAGTAVLLLFIALRHISTARALVVAATYGLGTCAFAISSQNLWQQTVDQFLLTLGAFFFLRQTVSVRSAVFTGLAFGAATACRATGVLALGAVFAHLFMTDRKKVLPLLLGAAPVPLAIAAYNQYYFGSPFVFAQELVGHMIAEQKTGSPALWQTPFWKGALGLLVSPSRGLLIFSPVLAASFWGMWRAFRDPSFRSYRPLIVAAVGMMAIQCKWFDWWGGHAYGYRPWLDALPYLVLSLVPVMGAIAMTALRRVLFGTALAWSVFVQVLGAFSYDRSWNFRRIFVVRIPESAEPLSFLEKDKAVRFAKGHAGGDYLGPSYCDIDLWFCRKRLWSVRDNMILYQLTHYADARGRRLPASLGRAAPSSP